MSPVKDSFTALHTVDSSMWNDLMIELESNLGEFVPQKIARTKDRVLWITNELKKQLRKQKKLFEKLKRPRKFTRAYKAFTKHKKQDTRGVAPPKSNGKFENYSKKKATILNDQFKPVFSEPFQLSMEQLSKQAMNDA